MCNGLPVIVQDDPYNHVQGRSIGDSARCDEQDAAHQQLIDMGGALRGLAEQQDHHCRPHGIGDADDGLLGNMPPCVPGHREQPGPHQGEAQGRYIGANAFRFHAHQECHCGAHGRSLGQGQIDKNNPPGNHMQTEIDMDGTHHQGGHQGPEYEIGHQELLTVPGRRLPAGQSDPAWRYNQPLHHSRSWNKAPLRSWRRSFPPPSSAPCPL